MISLGKRGSHEVIQHTDDLMVEPQMIAVDAAWPLLGDVPSCIVHQVLRSLSKPARKVEGVAWEQECLVVLEVERIQTMSSVPPTEPFLSSSRLRVELIFVSSSEDLPDGLEVKFFVLGRAVVQDLEPNLHGGRIVLQKVNRRRLCFFEVRGRVEHGLQYPRALRQCRFPDFELVYLLRNPFFGLYAVLHWLVGGDCENVIATYGLSTAVDRLYVG